MDKLKLLKSLNLFSQAPEDDLAKLGDFLTPEEHADGDVIIQEGTKGDTLYFIAEGRVRVVKSLPREGAGAQEAPAYKDLAIMGPGDCFGEMEILEKTVTRSASVIASGEAVLLRLSRSDLHRWLEARPMLAMGFFAQLVQVLSGRLRQSSRELTFIFDLSQILLERFSNPRELLHKVLERVSPHLEGDWTAGAYAYNEFNDELELVAAQGNYDSVTEETKTAAVRGGAGWLDDQTYVVSFPGARHALGFFLFRRSSVLSEEERTEFDRALTTTARLISTAIENIGFRAEESFRSRLKAVKTEGF
ncbi:MAG: cyclic nucleotide-binding domain-containing protein [Elusimicrobia bacterium]|nr:cyclic nucleotide-binding domain-containing protein [Elusimicrobiota bacterium]